MINFITGDLFTLSLAVFFIGMIYRVAAYIIGLDGKADRIAYRAHTDRSIRGIAASIGKWLLPWGTQGWRTQPVSAALFFLLHFGAVLVPLFLLGHTTMLEHALGISLPSLPSFLADLLSLASIVGLALIVARRLSNPNLRLLTTNSDWLILVLTILPFLTGVIARFEVFGAYEGWMLAHVLTGELFLILAPFTKLSHIVMFFMSRAQIGMDYAIKRGGRARGGAFPW